MTSDCGGMISDTMSKNTDDARRFVTESVIFSPLFGGSRNTIKPVKVINIDGKAILNK